MYLAGVTDVTAFLRPVSTGGGGDDRETAQDGRDLRRQSGPRAAGRPQHGGPRRAGVRRCITPTCVFTVGDTRWHTPWADCQDSVTPHQARLQYLILITDTFVFGKLSARSFQRHPVRDRHSLVEMWNNLALKIGPGGVLSCATHGPWPQAGPRKAPREVLDWTVLVFSFDVRYRAPPPRCNRSRSTVFSWPCVPACASLDLCLCGGFGLSHPTKPSERKRRCRH